MFEIRNLINGTLCEAASGTWRDSIDPATGKVHARAPESDAVDIDRAVDAAREAFPAWSNATPADRAAVLHAQLGCRLHIWLPARLACHGQTHAAPVSNSCKCFPLS